jgi:diacylglycerol kinase family enzyme
MKNFVVEIAGEERAEVSQLLAVRIGNFGGVLRDLAPGASLERDDLRLVLFHTHSRVAYLRYILRGLFGTNWEVSGIDLVHSTGVACHDLTSTTDSPGHARIFVEADGELLGTLPVEISVVPDALTLLVPD